MSTNSGRKEVLLRQFIANYNEENWFRPLNEILKDISDEEFNYKAADDINSIRQLVNHLIFWNERWLYRFKETPLPAFKKDNDATFEYLDENESSTDMIKRLFDLMEDWLNEFQNAKEEKMEADRMGRKDIPEEQIEPWWENMFNINIHNSYHIGQLILLRKLYKNRS